jgi:hypothetical protein
MELKTPTNKNPNGTEANAAGRALQVHARALRASQNVKRAEVWMGFGFIEHIT